MYCSSIGDAMMVVFLSKLAGIELERTTQVYLMFLIIVNLQL